MLLSLTIALAVFTNGFLAGTSFDTSLVKLPARRRIGNVAYAVFARGNDLGRGVIVYSTLAITAGLFVISSTIIALIQQTKGTLFLLLITASITTIIHFIGTAKAAPVMLSIKHTVNDEAILKSKLDKFERWHDFRACFQIITFFVLIYAFSIVDQC